ncbi:MAG: SDR family NAD(P)-dependent oxidoreductase, partial [Gammaproteobacteria bacterium]
MTTKTALITGSTSGIGLGIARAFAGQGMNIVLNGFGDAAEIEEQRRSLAAEFDITVSYDGADMTRPDEIERMMKASIGKFGRIDVLVNNAGIQHVAPIEDFPV